MASPDRPRARAAAAAALVGLATAALVGLGACGAPEPEEPQPTATVPGPVDPRETGVPDGARLERSGSVRITEDGAVVENLDVRGCVVVAADDVTIRNTRIRCTEAGTLMAVHVEGARLVVEDSEIDGGGNVEIGVGWSDYTLRRVDVHGVADGARFGHRVTVEDSWIHDMARIGSLHPDAVQTTSASEVVIRGNVLDPSRAGEEGSVDLNNAAIMLGSETGTKKVRDVLIEHNRLGGGNYTVNVRGDIDAEGVVIRDNVFVDDARYGPVLAPSSVELSGGNTMTGSDDGVQVDRAR